MKALLACEGLEPAPARSSHALLRMVLFNLLTGLERGHIDRDAARDVFIDLLDTLDVQSAGDGKAPHIDDVYGLLISVITDKGGYFSRKHAIVSHTDAAAITYQPSGAFAFWLKDVPEARKADHSAADVSFLIDVFEDRRRRIPGATVGKHGDVLWLAPNTGLVAKMIDEAWSAQRSEGHGALERGDHAESLRTLFGLPQRTSPERAVAVVMRRSIGQMQEVATEAAQKPRPDGSVRRRPFAAPTQFDANGHIRFRHWPTREPAPDADYGRTWSLDQAAGENGWPEFVVEPPPCDDVRRIVALGPIRSSNAGHKPGDDVAFADDVCSGASLASLITKMAERLDL